MSVPKTPTRAEQIQALTATVSNFGDGYYLVDSEEGDGWKYLCLPSKTNPFCDCPDHYYRGLKNKSYLCKHLEAVNAFLSALRAAKPSSVKQNLFSMQRHIAKVAKRQAEAKAQLDRLNEIPKGLAFIEAT